MKDVNLTLPVMEKSVNTFFQTYEYLEGLGARNDASAVEMQLLCALQESARALENMLALLR